MMQPKQTKYRKQQKGRLRGRANRGNKINFGEYGMCSLDRGRITSRQIEAARQVIARHVKRQGKNWIRIFPDKPVTKKALETRQGKGKGPVEYWVALVKPGTVLFEIEGVSRELAEEAFALAASKLSVGTRFLSQIGVQNDKN